MSWRGFLWLRVGVLVVAVAAGWLALASDAGAAGGSVWWGLSSGSRPASLSSGPVGDEVQDVSVAASSGTFKLVGPSEATAASFAWDASKGAVEAGLEGVYGAGNVKVSGGPGDATGSKPYVVRFIGALADQRVETMTAEAGGLNGGTVSVSEVARGENDGVIVIAAQDLGDSDASGASQPVRVEDVLPAGVTPLFIEGVAGEAPGNVRNQGPVSCVLASVSCSFSGTLFAGEQLEVRIGVAVETEEALQEDNVARVSGGGGAPRSVSRALSVGEEPRFGIEDYEMVPEEVGGAVDTRAGSHPFQLTSTVTLNQVSDGYPGHAEPVAMPRDLHFALPEGLVGNPQVLPQCTDEQFSKPAEVEGQTLPNGCPDATAVGIAAVTLNLPSLGGVTTFTQPVFNMVPTTGEPARFGFRVNGVTPVFLDTEIGPQTGYRVVVSSNDISQVPGFLAAKVTFWGVPGDPAHDGQRGWRCVLHILKCVAQEQLVPPPFLLMPSSCQQPFDTSVAGDSWAAPGIASVQLPEASYTLPGETLVGCNQLPFEPSISVAPDVSWGNTPTGLTVGVHVPQEADLNAEGLGEAAVRDTTVTLPEGLTINPGGADGLQACSELQAGLLGGLDGAGGLAFSAGPTGCPDGAKIGVARLRTPLLPNELTGAVYLASQDLNPFGSLVAMYMVLEDEVSGTIVKLAGEVSLTANGQIVSTFANTPQLPFEDLSISFFGGARAPLSTPAFCGAYTTTARFTSWSEEAAAADQTGRETSSTFAIDKGPSDGACIAPASFTPGFQAGSTNIQAGAYTPFTTTMTRPDSSEPLGGVSMRLPPGLSGMLSAVKLCPEPQASQGTCGPESLIGHTIVSAGLGSNPVTVKYPGSVYITGPYDGAPFGLSIANPAAAGPFDLESGTRCDCVVVRAKIEVDPLTAQLTITSAPLPTIIDGIPLQIQHVNVTIDRESFTFNPTSCNPMQITGTITSATGTPASVQTPLQVTNCAALAFKPGFKASTSSKTSRKGGASLHVNLTYPKEALGKDANIHEVRVELPKALPSRLSTLQQACTKAQFEANPAGCPAASVVGHAKAITPILPVPLEGPAYFVSYGTEWPQLILVLHGYGITIDLHGETHISKGITSSTFSSVPDQPVQSFELTLPEGPYSALAAPGGKLCSKKLVMPTRFIAQSGASVTQKTKIKVTGCKATRKKKHEPKKHRRHKAKHGSKKHKHAGKHKRHGRHHRS